ncbi:MAG: hypothetical protein V3U54_12880 [Thermodesulfobacteriota bacterium]
MITKPKILAYEIVKRIKQTEKENKPWSNLEMSKWIEEFLIHKNWELRENEKPIKQIIGALGTMEEWEKFLKSPEAKIAGEKHLELLYKQFTGE